MAALPDIEVHIKPIIEDLDDAALEALADALVPLLLKRFQAQARRQGSLLWPSR